MPDKMCEICDDAPPYALIYFNPKLEDTPENEPLDEDAGRVQYTCESCSQSLIDRGIGREIPLPPSDAVTTTHLDIHRTYIGTGEENRWISSDDAKSIYGNR